MQKKKVQKTDGLELVEFCDPDQLTRFTIAELKMFCRKHKLIQRGKKVVIVERIQKYMAEIRQKQFFL